MDGRDIIVVMPTGGGKSLTYQLPALLSPGCTVFISPLISLITDQCLHLEEAGVKAIFYTGSMSNADVKSTNRRLEGLASGEVSAKDGVKLCYVTVRLLQNYTRHNTDMSKFAA